MEKKLIAAIRFAVAGVAIVGGVAVLNATTAKADTAPQMAMFNGAEPPPMCDPDSGHCKIPGRFVVETSVEGATQLWNGAEPPPMCDPDSGHCKIPGR